MPSHHFTSQKTSQKLSSLLLFACLGLLCLGFRCGPTVVDCLNDTDCVNGYTCQSYHCRSSRPGCQDSRDCLPDQLCQQGSCVERPATCKPQAEVCDNKDNDCNGKIDENDNNQPLERACYTGPIQTQQVGLCHAGTQRCEKGQWGACQNQRLPVQEVCGDKQDNDCDGQVDEDCPISRELYDWCHTTKATCKAGLICHSYMCHQPCDLQRGKHNNPDCPEPSQYECYEGVCKQKCMREKNDCPAGMACQPKLELCLPNLPPRQGPRTLSETCTNQDTPTSQHCDSGKGFVCISGICEVSCKPGQATCPTGQRCITSQDSYTGGYCK